MEIDTITALIEVQNFGHLLCNLLRLCIDISH